MYKLNSEIQIIEAKILILFRMDDKILRSVGKMRK